MSGVSVHNFTANCPAGMETLVGREIKSFGGVEVSLGNATVTWKGALSTAYRACLWSRFAARILLLLDRVEVNDRDELYRATKKLGWEEHLSPEMSFAVFCTTGYNPFLTHSKYAALLVKDGIADYFRQKFNTRPDVNRERPDVRVHLHIEQKTASLYLDLSGDSLHRRGYRDATGVAPLKENLAAAIVALAGWGASAPPESTFLDPMCGSGTLLIEAALMWSDSAPGLSRTKFGFSRWLGHQEKLWSSLVDEAVEREETGLSRKWPRFLGFDSDPEVVAVARKNIANAGLDSAIEVKCKDFAHLRSPSRQGFLVVNLPYGERLAEKTQVGYLYSCVGTKLKNCFSGWRVGLFIAQPDLTDRFALPAVKSHKLYNGPLACRLVTGTVSKEGSKTFSWKVNTRLKTEEGVDFANRLKKNFKKMAPWAEKNNISCFRIYERDLPDFNAAIDVYDKWILVQEYAPPSTIDGRLANKRKAILLETVRDFFQVGRERVFIKQRFRQKGRLQYQKIEKKPKFHQVREGNCSFLVNFTNYLDTGLFLDHRPIREKIAAMANNKRFLNLFGYTGTATVHAAMGGAARTTTVDLSTNYLEWAGNNLALNGFSLRNHELVAMDSMGWLKDSQQRYDIIFIDPPTFSNTKKKSLLFDVQKNHYELITRAAELLEEGGCIIFSTNFKGFSLDNQLTKTLHVVDITESSVPFDFRRNRFVHMCWELQKRT